jgi:hypothetical protein
MFSRDYFLVADRLARLHAEADRARIAAAFGAPAAMPRGVSWRIPLALALVALADAIARPARRDDACADCI